MQAIAYSFELILKPLPGEFIGHCSIDQITNDRQRQRTRRPDTSVLIIEEVALVNQQDSDLDLTDELKKTVYQWCHQMLYMRTRRMI